MTRLQKSLGRLILMLGNSKAHLGISWETRPYSLEINDLKLGFTSHIAWEISGSSDQNASKNLQRLAVWNDLEGRTHFC